MSNNVFKEMTNLYSLSKTLRFELKPDIKTKEYLQSSWILARDTQRDWDYDIIKPLFDKLHDRFIRESLSDVENIDWEDFVTTYNAFRAKVKSGWLEEKDKKIFQKDLDDRMTILRKQIVSQFDIMAEERKNNQEWQEIKKDKTIPFLKESGYKILTEQGILKVLEKEYAHCEKELKAIKNFNGFFSYFIWFNQNRENYYSNEAKSTAVAYRVIDQNLLTFAVNCLLYDQVKEMPTITSEELQVFEPNYYSQCLHQDGIDRYNNVIGGEKDDSGNRITDGINVKINLYNQQNNKKEGFRKIPKLKQLYKQIGSIVAKSIPFTLIQNDSELTDTIDNLITEANEKNLKISELLTQIGTDQDIDYDTIWISKSALTNISNRYFSSWYLLQEKASELKIFGYKKNDEDPYKVPLYISLGQLKQLLENIVILQSEDEDKQQYLFKKHFEVNKNSISLRNGIENNWEYFLVILHREFERLLNRDEVIVDEEDDTKSYRFLWYQQARDAYLWIKNIDKNSKEHKNIIKQLVDSALSILQFFKLFRIDQNKLDGKEFDQDRYAQFDEIVGDYPLTKWYDAIRNYMTKKPFSEEKMKLNFDSSTLLAWWDKNKETQNLSIILKKDEKYYLAIMKKDQNKFFEKNDILYKADISGWEKMEYKLLPWPNKMLPKCLMPGKDRKKYGASDEVLRLYDAGEFKKWDNFSKESLITLVDFYKQWLQKYEDWKVFNFQFKPSDQYEDISKFYSEVEKQGYKLSWRNINEQILQEGVESGQIYLFQISSKDFDGKSKTPDLQTLYWRAMFALWTNVKLNGEAEVFWRNKSIAKEKKELKEDKFDVYNNNRYTEDKILFHVPITLGFGNKGWSRFNETFNREILIPHHEDMYVIGIDRGEKHLAFYSVISVKTGKIVEQGTLNTVWSTGKEVDYEAKLREKADTRLAARQNWDVIGNIKNLKEWYISQVVKKITDLMVQYNAIVVFEDLNWGFKNSRKKIEQSVYQKLELALVKKLNFLADKKIDNGEVGSVTNPYQLTPPVNTFGDIKGKQRWAVFYTRANYTSQTDPVTGWRKTIYLKKGKIENMKKQLTDSFESLVFDKEKKVYVLSYGQWQLWSDVERRKWANDKASWKWISKKYDPTQLLNEWCEMYNFKKEQNIIDQIEKKIDKELTADMLANLIWILDLIMQIRNSDTEKNDLILSPVEKGWIKFDSRIYFIKAWWKEITNSIEFPTSWDANGAYNIARKGMMMIQRILDNPERPDLLIRDSEWDEFVSE